MKHRHHIVPVHDGGTNDESNMTPPISVALHAAFHKDRWDALGQVGDFIAWKTLTGQMTMSEASILASRTANSGRKLSEEWRARIAAAGKNRPVSAETRAKIGAAHKGKRLSVAHRAKVGVASRGRKHSEETRRKIAAFWKGRKRGPRSDEHRKKLSESLTGKTYHFSDEHKANLSTAITAWWRQRKAEDAA